MGLLSKVGNLYMAILILLLIISMGMLLLKFFRWIFNIGSKVNITNKKMDNNNSNTWLKLSLLSFTGIVISGLIMLILE